MIKIKFWAISSLAIISIFCFSPAFAKNSEKQAIGAGYRSAIANFVQDLLQVAEEQESNIGQQVRVMAQQQNQAEEATVQIMQRIETRNRIKTFLIGSDYKNLGALRSEIVQTRNRLEQLNRLMESIQGEENKLKLQNQVQEMEQEQARIENFIKEQESGFSLFGWLFKFLNR